jgi:tetratricopeptide (TPR) repeat protein
MAQLYNNLGLVENMIGKVENALDNYKKSIELKKQIGDNVGLTNSYSNLGSLYATMNDFDASLKCHQSALEIAQRSGLRENANGTTL